MVSLLRGEETMFKDCYGNRFPNEKKLHIKYGRCGPIHVY